MTSSTRYTCEIILHRAINVPVSDLNDLCSDPYIVATLSPIHNITGSSGPPTQSISYRTHTVRRNLNPVWDAPWLVSGVPASGFVLTLSLLDEDPASHDDMLGKAVLRIPDSSKYKDVAQLEQGWTSGEREYKVHKHHGSLRTRVGTYIAKVVTRGRVRHRVRAFVSVRVLGPAPHFDDDDGERIYTLGPHIFVQHFSPLAARLMSAPAFKASRIQLTGPVPSCLRHRYVGYAPFVKAMFRSEGIRGICLNRALHKQHRSIYRWDRQTIWGIVENSPKEESTMANGKHGAVERLDEAFARRFLDMVEYGTEGRLFTYVIMLDGQWRFTETGEEFAINFLSKHTMHSDVATEIAYSGEFFVRRIRHARPHHPSHKPHPDTAPRDPDPGSGQDERANGVPEEITSEVEVEVNEDEEHREPSSYPPSAYELVIDNDSGTYRPHADLLPALAAFLSRPANLGALGRVRAMDWSNERLKRWKEGRKEEKRRARGATKGKIIPVLRQASFSPSGSSSSSESGASSGSVVRERMSDKEAELVAKLEPIREKDTLKEVASRMEQSGDEDGGARREERVAGPVEGQNAKD